MQTQNLFLLKHPLQILQFFLIKRVFIHNQRVFRFSGTCHRVNGSISMVLSHIFCVLKQSRTNAKEYGSMHIASLHISCAFRLSGVSLIHTGIISSRDISIHTLKPRQRSNFMDRTQITSKWL